MSGLSEGVALCAAVHTTGGERFGAPDVTLWVAKTKPSHFFFPIKNITYGLHQPLPATSGSIAHHLNLSAQAFKASLRKHVDSTVVIAGGGGVAVEEGIEGINGDGKNKIKLKK